MYIQILIMFFFNFIIYIYYLVISLRLDFVIEVHVLYF